MQPKITLTLLLCILCRWGYGQVPFTFQELAVAPGTKAHFTVPITDGTIETFLPITIFHGTEVGPVLGLTAGVHGYEYGPILAGQRLIGTIDPTALRGTVILVQVASVGSFLGRSPYVSPLDEKNLNRVFPGSPEGTVTERIAYFLSTKVIPRCTHFVDAHSGDAPEDLADYSAYYQHDDLPEASQVGRDMARHMGYDRVVIFRTTDKDYMKPASPSTYCSAEAFKQGIPAVDIECGRLGLVEEKLVEKIVQGISSLMAHLGMTSGTPLPSAGTLFIAERTYLSSQYTGFFYPLKTSGEYVQEGMKLGYITDFFNQALTEIYAPATGIILYMLGTPPVNEGETLVSIGLVE